VVAWFAWLRIRTPADARFSCASAPRSPTAVNLWSIVLPAAAGAVGVAAWGAVYPTSQLFGPALCRTTRPSAIALTFDDGPNPAATPELLALLERHRARATFFLVGRFARACPELVGEISARGHLIGNHTETHRNLALLSTSRIQQEILRCQESIVTATNGSAPTWMRPPFGFRGPQLWTAVRRAGLRGVVQWSLTCHDWKPQPPSRLIARLAKIADSAPVRAADSETEAIHGGEMVLLHDGDFRELGGDRRHVLAALEHWLPRWRDLGFEFVTVDQIAGTAPLL
jgi:peptidoglycan/xylan/chitin deacetylase (PgdA/CDA1 family)